MKEGILLMFEIQAHINSLGGELDLVTIIEHKDNNHVIAKYKDKYYTAVFNPYVGNYYVDDKFGHIKDIDTFKF